MPHFITLQLSYIWRHDYFFYSSVKKYIWITRNLSAHKFNFCFEPNLCYHDNTCILFRIHLFCDHIRLLHTDIFLCIEIIDVNIFPILLCATLDYFDTLNCSITISSFLHKWLWFVCDKVCRIHHQRYYSSNFYFFWGTQYC